MNRANTIQARRKLMEPPFVIVFSYMRSTLVLLFLLWNIGLAQTPPDSPFPSNYDILKILTVRVDTQKQALGIVVGVIEPKGRRLVSHGSLAAGDKRPLNGDTVFEIGSVTKVFTSLLLSDMAQRGEVSLNDPVAKYLPKEGAKMPQRGGREITLVDLATHTSGL